MAACGATWLDILVDTALVRAYDPWTFIDYHRRERICSSLVKQFKMTRTWSGQVEPVPASVTTAPYEKAKQNPKPAQPLQKSMDKFPKAGKVEKIVAKLKKSGDSAGCSPE